MAPVLQRKRALFWALGILTALVLTNLAWTEIAHSLRLCFSPY
jgi:hypothetical protein